MADTKNHSSYQQKIIKKYYDNQNDLMIQKLGEIVSDLYLATNDKTRNRLWENARKALHISKVDKTTIASIMSERNIEALAKIAGDLIMTEKVNQKSRFQTKSDSSNTPALSPSPASAVPAAPPSPLTPTSSKNDDDDQPIDAAMCKKAMKAFRKRLKLTILDDESRLGVGVMTSGNKSAITAIMPPYGYPPEVWVELEKQGKIKNTGRGFYKLTDG